MSPIIISFLSVSPFISANTCLIFVGSPIWGVYMLMTVIFSSCIDYHYIMSFIFMAFFKKFIFSYMNIAIPA